MSAAEDLERLARAACDVANLAGTAAELVAEAEAGDAYRLPMLGAVLRALLVQAKALHGAADEQMVAAYRTAPSSSDKGN